MRELCNAPEDEARVQQCLEEKAIMQRTHAKTLWHVPPPAMLGNGRTSLLSKLRVFVHTFGLLSDSQDMLAKLLRSIVSLHTDYGTEVGLVRVKPAALSEVLPYMHLSSEDCSFRDLPSNQDQDVFNEGAGGNLNEHMASGLVALRDDPDFFSTPISSLCDMSFCLEGPDLNHVIHNITEDLSGVMKTYPDFLVGLKRVCKLLASPESKQQLLENVFGSGLGLAFRSEVAGFKCKVHEKRGVPLPMPSERFTAWRQGYVHVGTYRKILNGRHVPEPKEDANGEEHGVHLPGANAALLSEHWWACLSVMLLIADTQAAAIAWINGCPVTLPSRLRMLGLTFVRFGLSAHSGVGDAQSLLQVICSMYSRTFWVAAWHA